jgi:hypothetical protein
MIAQVLTPEQMSQCEGREYNPQTWERNINNMLKYSDVIFYQVKPDEHCQYHRYYCEYTLPEGLRLFSSFGYSSSLTNGGFYRLDKSGITADGKTMMDLYNLVSEGNTEGIRALAEEIASTDRFDISFNPMCNEEGKEFAINTSQQARQWMIERCKNHGMTFTKGL